MNSEKELEFPVTFPMKLYYLLEKMDLDANACIRWNETGISFRVVDRHQFCEEIIPKFFRRKYSFLFCVLT